MKLPRVLICAGSSGSGKTLITCGILQALCNRGMKMGSFKCGPDYIDPMFHTKVIGTKSRNLDSFFTEAKVLRHILQKNGENLDFAVIEGVMGYYDGLGGVSTDGSAYHVGRLTETPAVLIVNCKGMSLSIAAHVAGFLNFRSDSNIVGVILNQVSPMIYQKVKAAVEEETGVKVIGYVPVVKDCQIESRHLGLVMPDEIADIKERLNKLANILEETLDLDLLLELGAAAPPIQGDLTEDEQEELGLTFRLKEPLRIAIAKDEAFCFMYEDNLDLLQSMGAELVPFSPIHDEKLPDNVCGLLLYGGYPELYAHKLAGNLTMKEDLLRRCREGMPVLAECGGFMYLHETMESNEGVAYPMVGLIAGQAYKTEKLGRFGYISLKAQTNVLGEDMKNESLPAHEFHYFDSTNPGDDFYGQKPVGNRGWKCLHSSPTMLAGFPHLYYYGNTKPVQAFLKRCSEYRRLGND